MPESVTNPVPESSGPESLCLLRLSALGDIMHTVPTVRAIQDYWPDTKITWVIGSLERRLLKNFSGVEFVVFHKPDGLRAFRQLRKTLKNRRFDVLLHMQVALRANLASRLIKAERRIGWDRARSRDRHHWFINESVPKAPFQHQQLGFLSFAHALGIPEGPPRWDLPLTAEDEAFADLHLDHNRPTLVISPCSSHVLRNWHAKGYAAVADYARRQWDMQVILAGGPSALEQSMAAEIESLMGTNALNLVGKDTLTQSLSVLKRATVVLSPDSGPAHIANAMGTDVIGLYACTWSKRSGPYHSLQHCVDRFEVAAQKYRKSDARDLRWGTRIEQPGVMDLIAVDDVLARLDQVMSQHNAKGTTALS